MSVPSTVFKHIPISVCRHFLGNIDLPWSPIQSNKTRQFRPCVQGLDRETKQGDDTFIREYTGKSREEHGRADGKRKISGSTKQWQLLSFVALRIDLYLFYYRRKSLPEPRSVNNSHATHTPELGVGTAPYR
ncbi:hypothetical protein AVEN_155370-1 [Araneus ventricosus]|uniref:Uncharacterized protein n=1 Tax=Araneus ventricosus TaxID=182803 RepID=A0A4Y2MWY3_ARAVE|nr:hypothetical protein AVEN_155370-1 [Araneus ventricosus]